jgi:hypothetical protein
VASQQTNEARKRFADAGLTYADVTSGDILVLVMMINKHMKQDKKNGVMAFPTLHMSEKMNIKRTSSGSITECYLYCNAHYFTRRECISFNVDGFIGFAGWADYGSSKQIIDAFNEWVDYLKECKHE